MAFLTSRSALLGSASIASFLAFAAFADQLGAEPPETLIRTAAKQADGSSTAQLFNGLQYFKVTLPSAGTYVFAAPTQSGVVLRVNGQAVLDLSERTTISREPSMRSITSLPAGEHVVEISGGSPSVVSQITLHPLGAQPVPIKDQALVIDAAAASELLARPQQVAGGTGQPVSGNLGVSGTPFLIGGGSAAANRAGPTASENNGPAATSNGGFDMAGMMAAQRMGSDTGERRSVVTGGSTLAVPTSTGSSNGSGGGGGGGQMPGQSPITPGNPGSNPGLNPVTPVTPTPNPTPNPNPPATPNNGASAGPLAPPQGIAISQAVQLTSAGDAEGRVASTGTTLFGAVMNPTMFDTVRVTLNPSGRTTTVDTGPTTGQFAVRLFPEDFAQGADVTVTLEGAFSANSEVASTPVSYTVQGAMPEDGLAHALSRLSFGPTADLYSRVRAMGYNAYVEEQLAPETISDAVLNSMQPQQILDPTTRNGGSLLNSLDEYNIAYATHTEKQLREVMAAFWRNHFHASTKGTSIYQQNIADNEFFRENAFGRFEDLLLYSARSPLMSQFLDNDESRRGRINENYAREILELHTVGVDGGYGDEDIIAIARVFTGWHYRQTNEGADDVARLYEFEFKADRHDTDDKVIPFLNLTITGQSGAAGVQEGEQLIGILSDLPQTRSYVCGKLVTLLVADQPPQSFIDNCVAAWVTSDGDTEAMLRAILLDPTYITSVEFQRNKAKTPFEYAVSTARAFGVRPEAGDNPRDFYNDFRETMTDAGYNPLRFPVPTGLAEVSSAWINTASMIDKFQQTAQIAERRERFNIDLAALSTEAGLETAEEVAAYLLGVATADRYQRDEFEAVVAVLKGADGIFEPRVTDETRAYERALGLITVLPSFQLQ